MDMVRKYLSHRYCFVYWLNPEWEFEEAKRKFVQMTNCNLWIVRSVCHTPYNVHHAIAHYMDLTIR